MVIGRGTTPGSVANEVISSGLVECEKATIATIPVSEEAIFEPHVGKLLSKDDILRLWPSMKFFVNYKKDD